jgi:hypothetical protein
MVVVEVVGVTVPRILRELELEGLMEFDILCEIDCTVLGC